MYPYRPPFHPRGPPQQRPTQQHLDFGAVAALLQDPNILHNLAANPLLQNVPPFPNLNFSFQPQNHHLNFALQNPNFPPLPALHPPPSLPLPSNNMAPTAPLEQLQSLLPQQGEILERADRAVEKAWRELLGAGEGVSAQRVSERALVALQAVSWGTLGLRMQQLPTFSRLMATEGKINAFIHCFVGVQRISSLYELEVAICKNEGIEQFEELQLGPLLQHPLVLHYFSVDSSATKVFKITTEEIIFDLSEFMDSCEQKSKQKSIAADEFLDFVTKKRSVKGKGMLGVRIQSLGMHASFILEAKGSENETLKKCQEPLLRKRFISKRLTKDLKERASSISKRIESFSSMHTEFCGKHIRFVSSSSDDEESDDSKSEGDQTSSWSKLPSQNMSHSDRVSSCPYPSATEEISRLGLTVMTGGHSSSAIDSSMGKKRKQSLRNKTKTTDANCITSAAQPCKLLKGGTGKHNNHRIENGVRYVVDTSELDVTLSENFVKTFIATWKEACKEHTVAEVLESMLQFYNPTDKKTTARRQKKIKSRFSKYPYIGLLNVAITSIKCGMWDNIYDALQAITQHDDTLAANSPIFEIIDVEQSEEHMQVISEPILQQKNSIAVEDIIKMVTRYYELHEEFSSDGKPPSESSLTCLRKLHSCELWLVKQFCVKDFKSLGYGEFLTFLENHTPILSAQVQNILSGDISEKSPLEVSVVQQQLVALVSQALNCVWDDETISKEMISSLLRRQFPLLGFTIKENCPLDNFLETVTNFKNTAISQSVLFSAALFKNCLVGDQYLSKGDGVFQRIAVKLGLRESISSLSVTSKNAIEALLRAPMLSDLNSWSHWDVIFAPSLGPLVEWLLTEVNSTEMFCLVTQDGNVIKIDPSATAESFMEAAVQKSSFQTAVKLVSLFSLAGGEKQVPLSLLKGCACQAFEVVVQKHSVGIEVLGTEWPGKFDGSCASNLDSTKMDQGVVIASRFVLDCLGYLPSEFCGFAADVLLSGMNSVVKYASLAILSECNEKERLMLHKIGLSVGIEEWIDDFQASCFMNKSDLSEGSNHSTYGKNALDKISGSHGETAAFSMGNANGNCNIDVAAVSVSSCSTVDVSDIGNKDAALVIESIRKDEFGLDPNLSHMESSLLKKHHARLGRALHCLSQELYSQDSHFLLELVQNADDNIYPQDVEPTLSFILRESGIVILNNEQGFSAQNIRALCDVGNSTKKMSGAGYIGQKGIGFKSVFRITDAPEIHSNGFHIKFDISEGQIGFVLPTVVPPCNIDFFHQLLFDTDEMDSRSWRTCIVLPFRSKISERTAMEMFLDLHPSLLLFLHRLQCIMFRNTLNDSLMVMRKKIVGDGLVNVSCGEDKMTWLVASQKLRGHKSRPKVKTTEIAIAFTLEQLNDGTYVPLLEQLPVFSFLPLRTYGLKFILQGDFILPSSREEVDKNNVWNQWLLTKFPALFVNAEKLFCSLSCFRECPGKAVAAYMSFVPLLGEVHGFFSGLPRAITMELQRTDCLLLEGDHSKMVPPCNALRGWNDQACCLLPDELLKEHLGLGFLDKDIVLSDSVARALGVAEYGAEMLIKFMAALCRKENGLQSMGFGWLSLWLSALYSMISHSSGQTDVIEKLRCIPFIPLSDGTYSSVDVGTIWLHSDVFVPGSEGVQGPEVFSMLYAKLRTVNPLLLAASANDEAVADNKLLMLLKVGVQQLSEHEIMKIHVLPAISDDRSTMDKNLMTEYLCFAMIHLHSSCPSCSAERKHIISELQNKAFIATNHGYRRPMESALHFSKEFGNPVDIHKLINGADMEWHEVDAVYLKHPASKLLSNALIKWREFFHEIGVTDFVCVSEIDKSIGDLSLNSLKKFGDKDLISLASVAKDWDSPELVHLLSLVSAGGSGECAKYLLEVFDIFWDDYFSGKTTGYCSLKSSSDTIPFKSSFVNHICDVQWVVSSMDNKLHYPKDLFYECDAVQSILGSSAPYALPKVRSQKLVHDFGFKTTVDVSDALEMLRGLGKPKTPFQASIKQMSMLYTFIWNEIVASKTKLSEAFHSIPFIFVPLYPCSAFEELVYGVLLTSKEVCWHDPAGCLDLIKVAPPQSMLTGATGCHLRRTLCNIYPGFHDFFVDKCEVCENPSLCGYLDILWQLSNLTSPFQASSAVFQVLLKWTDGLKSGLLGSEDIIYLRDCLKEMKYRVLPTSQHKWVSMHSSFGIVCWCDDKVLWERYKNSNTIHLLSFGKPSEDEQDMVKTNISLIMQKLEIPALSEVIIRVPVYYGVRSNKSKTSLINWALPYAQRYIYSLQHDRYAQLKESGFDDLVQLHVIVVAKLQYRNKIQGRNSPSKQKFRCSCLLQGNTFYTTSDSDSHDLFLELSRLFFDGKPELHLANFLHMIATMVEAGCSEEQIGLFVLNSQKVPKLPDKEATWSLSSIPPLTELLEGEDASTEAELHDGGDPTTGKDELPKAGDSSAAKDKQKVSKSKGARNSSDWPPADWRTAPDSSILQNEQKLSKFKKRPRISSDSPPVDWITAADFNYASVNGFRTQAAVGSSGRTENSNSTITDRADGMQLELNAVWAIEESTPSYSLDTEYADSNLVDVFQQPLDLDLALRPAPLHPMSEGPESSSSRLIRKYQGNSGVDNGGQAEAMLAGRLGEHVAFKYLANKFGKESVRWVNEDNETFLPYDIIIGDEESIREYIEVKATRYGSKDWFTISMREWQFAVEKGESFSIVHVLLCDKNNARVTTFKNPAKLCQLGKLQLVIMMQSKESS